MNLKLYESVVLLQDLPQYNLQQGDLATLIDFIPHPNQGETGCILEVFNALGESIQVITVPQSWITLPESNQIPTVRTLVTSY